MSRMARFGMSSMLKSRMPSQGYKLPQGHDSPQENNPMI